MIIECGSFLLLIVSRDIAKTPCWLKNTKNNPNKYKKKLFNSAGYHNINNNLQRIWYWNLILAWSVLCLLELILTVLFWYLTIMQIFMPEKQPGIPVCFLIFLLETENTNIEDWFNTPKSQRKVASDLMYLLVQTMSSPYIPSFCYPSQWLNKNTLMGILMV